MIEDRLEVDLLALSKELATLARQQYEALQKLPYPKMSSADAEAYDQRRLRIAELSKRLSQ